MNEQDEIAAQVELLKKLHGPDPMAEHREWLAEYDRAVEEERRREGGE